MRQTQGDPPASVELELVGAPPLEPLLTPPPAAAPRVSLPRDSVYRRALAIADLVAAGISLVVLDLVGNSSLRLAGFVVLPLAVLIGKFVGLYDREGRVIWSTTLDEAPGVSLMALLYTVVIWLGAGSLVPGHAHKGQFVLAWAAMVAATLGGRVVARHAARALTARERCLVLGEPASFERVRRRLKFGEGGAAEVVLGIDVQPGGFGAILEDGTLHEVVREYDIQRVVIASSGHDTDEVLELIRLAGGLDVKVSVLPTFWETLGSLVVDEMPGTAMLAVRRFGLSRSSELVKRGLDLLVASAALMVLSPLLAALALLVKLTSHGPVLFRQVRVGRHGRTFEMLKFRTMVPDAEVLKRGLLSLNEADGLFKIRDDPRVTPLGRWLRRTNLDELPQLVNVVRGEMSLVGPRPLILDEDASIVGWRRRRLDVPPGMTGHWQVLGGARVPLDEMVVIDYLYIANWSLWRDVKCLLRTVACVVARRGI
jgi:exopolysaccharide biosynthesis polyprenyl glycosylphosphotransferase